MFEQLPGTPRILRRHDVALFLDADRAQRHVLQIADRRGDEVKCGWRERRQFHAHILTCFQKLKQADDETVKFAMFEFLASATSNA